MFYLGIDNGVSGSIGILSADQSVEIYFPIPTKRMLNYQKSKEAYINRVDIWEAKKQIQNVIGDEPAKILLERPMVNPERFIPTTSALRALEATVILLESLGLGYEYVDSKAWQKEFFPKGEKGTDLKLLSREVGVRKYPKLREAILKHKDADGILIAEFCRIYYTQPVEEVKKDTGKQQIKENEEGLF